MATSRKKWTPEILAKLERGESTDQPYQEKVNQLKETVRNGKQLSPAVVATLYRDSRARLDEIEETRYAEQMLCTALEQMLQKSLEDKEIGWGLYGAQENAVRLPDGYTISVNAEPAAQVIDREVFRQWCLDNDMGAKMALHPSVVNSLVKERLLAGMPLPAGTTAHVYEKVQLTKPRNKQAEED